MKHSRLFLPGARGMSMGVLVASRISGDVGAVTVALSEKPENYPLHKAHNRQIQHSHKHENDKSAQET